MPIPSYSNYVKWDILDDDEVHAQWHAVHFPEDSPSNDELVYAWLDRHANHSWTVNQDRIYFLDENNALEYALVWG